MPTNVRKTASAAAIGNFQGMLQALKRRVIQVMIPDGLAATTTILAHITDVAAQVIAMDFTPLATVSLHASNYWQIGLKDETAAVDILSAAATTILNNVADLTAKTTYEHVLAARYGKVEAGSLISVVLTKNASGATLPAGLVRILIEES